MVCDVSTVDPLNSKHQLSVFVHSERPVLFQFYLVFLYVENHTADMEPICLIETSQNIYDRISHCYQKLRIPFRNYTENTKFFKRTKK